MVIVLVYTKKTEKTPKTVVRLAAASAKDVF